VNNGQKSFITLSKGPNPIRYFGIHFLTLL
jgi:hypothetical protein